jgi:raffinose/stachyose/melibiose transport system permease protein
MVRRHLTPWLFTGPMVLLVGLVFLFPVVGVFRYSFQRVGSGSIESEWVGFDNYSFVYRHDLFWSALLNNAQLLLCVPILIALAAIVSALLFDRVKGWKTYRTFLFFPYILSIPVVGIVFGYVFQLNGLFNTALRNVGLGALAQDWLGTSSRALWTIMAVIVWKELGFGIIVFLARLMSVNEEMFESAKIDGAGWWQRFRYITLPQLTPAIVFFGIVETITMLSWVFAYIYVMTSGGPGNSTVVSEWYIFQQVFTNGAIGIGSAAAVTLLGFVSLFIVVRVWLVRRTDELAYA